MPVDDTSIVLAVAVADTSTEFFASSINISAQEVEIASPVKGSIKEVGSAPSTTTNVKDGATDTVPLNISNKEAATLPALANKLSAQEITEKDSAARGNDINIAMSPFTEE